jgi:murein DD-endopeptidase MepM/ murein hydrolase activator NlpD
VSFECIVQGGAQLTQGFGCTNISIEGPCPGCEHWHSGVDLAAPCGREVYASCAGLVVGMGDDPGYGPFALFIQRDGDGVVELYGHLQAAMVGPGDRVAAGQVIGHVGTLGNSTGCHLHYSVRPPDDRLTECRALNPTPYLCSCRTAGRTAVRPGTQPTAPPNGLAVLLLLGAGASGLAVDSPAPPGLGITWEP